MYDDPSQTPQYSMMSSVVSADKRTGRQVALALVAGIFVLSAVITFFALFQGKEPKELQSSPVSLVSVEPEGQDSHTGASGAVSHIYIGELGSNPDTLSISPGTTVVWHNSDGIPHNISGDDMGSNHVVEPGDTLMFVYSQPGEYSFIDNGLTGTVTVTE